MDTKAPELDTEKNVVSQSLPAEPAMTETPETEADEAQAQMEQTDAQAEHATDYDTLIAEEAAAADESDADPLEQEAAVDESVTLESLAQRATEILERPGAEINRDEISRLKQQFSNLRKAQVDAERQTHIDAGNDPESFTETPCETEAAFKETLNAIKEKKAAHLAAVEAERAENLKRKNDIIEQIIALAEDTDNVNRTFPRYRELQDEFNAIGDVPAPEETSLWKRFQDARERYSDNLKINKELRDYDFKKNLGEKELIITEAEGLDSEADVITAFRRLQELHTKWREIGPVAKELRDEVWNRFKEASVKVNKRYQDFFEERKAREAENEAGKIAICERVEALDFTKLESFAAWDQMTEVLKAAQEDWKKLGFASRKLNNALFNRFRATCDTFFALKATYFKNVKEELARNLAAKTALVERAEALKDSTEWKKTADELVELQKEWKKIGTVAKKHSDNIWRRFQTACDYFFEQKKAATSGIRHTEQANLQAKRDLIKELDNITAETPKEEARQLINDLQERWKSIGHVPFREKDKIYDAFRNRINEVRREFDLNDRRARQERFESVLAEADNGNQDKAYRERERQMRLLETRRAELRTYENNLGFLNAKSKNGNSLVADFERKIERLKADIAVLEEKVRLLDSKL